MKCLSSGSQGNCYILTDSSNHSLILDCGVKIDSIKQALNFNVTDIDGCVVTHSHLDHSLSADKLKKMGIPTYQPYIDDKPIAFRGNSKFKVKAIPMTDLENNFVHTNSDGTPCKIYGFLISHEEIGRLLYITDVEFIKWQFKGLNHILIECNYDKSILDGDEPINVYEHRLRGHLELNTCKDFIKANDTDSLNNIVLCHLSNNFDNSEHFIEEIKKVSNKAIYVAHRGMSIEL